MEVYGNINALKKGIEERYEKEIQSIELDVKEKSQVYETEKKKKLAVLKADFKTRLEEKTKEAKQRVLNEKKLEAKKDFEQARELLIQEVFEEIRKKSLKYVLKKEYLSFVKKHVPKGSFEIIVGPSALKKSFARSKDEKGLVGVKYIGKEIIYDFSINSLLEAKEDLVRHIITKNLFGE